MVKFQPQSVFVGTLLGFCILHEGIRCALLRYMHKIDQCLAYIFSMLTLHV